MFIFGDIARTTRLFHSSQIDELMAEPPVVGAGRKPAREDATVTRLFHSSESDELMAEPPVPSPASPPVGEQASYGAVRRRERAAA